MATPECPFAHFASVDWATKHKHHAVILNAAGQIVAAFSLSTLPPAGNTGASKPPAMRL
jgi:hypothetical protein